MTRRKDFWGFVEKGPACWLWIGGGDIYGRYTPSGRLSMGAHRWAWELTSGPIPSGLRVLHRCDTPKCVRPDHLFLGTSSDNTRDMHAKGRWHAGNQKGERNGRARLSDVQVAELRSLYVRQNRWRSRTGMTQSELAQRFGITQAWVSAIVRGVRRSM